MKRPVRRTALLVVTGVLALLPTLAVASGGAAAPTSSDWTTFGYGNGRGADNAGETTLSAANVPGLHQVWSHHIGGALNGQPLVVSGVVVNGTKTTLVLVGSENGTLQAVKASTGALIWSRSLGSETISPCHDTTNQQYGITGTPAVDKAHGVVYAVSGTGQLYALDIATGNTLPGWPSTVTSTPTQEHAYSAVTLGQYVYVTIAGYCDQPPYKGRVVAFDPTSGAVVGTFEPTGSNGPSGGGIWSMAGLSINPVTGNVYVATGNAVGTTETYGRSDAVVMLGPKLKVIASNQPPLTGSDVDFGSTPVQFQAPGCAREVAVENKSGVLFVYPAGGIGSGPTQSLQVADPSDWEFIGTPAYDPVTRQLLVANSSDTSNYPHGLLAFDVTANCTLQLAWSQSVGVSDDVVPSPVIANGVVYYADGHGDQVFAFNASDGTALWNSGTTIGGRITAPPTVADGQLYAVANGGYLHAYGP